MNELARRFDVCLVLAVLGVAACGRSHRADDGADPSAGYGGDASSGSGRAGQAAGGRGPLPGGRGGNAAAGGKGGDASSGTGASNSAGAGAGSGGRAAGSSGEGGSRETAPRAGNGGEGGGAGEGGGEANGGEAGSGEAGAGGEGPLVDQVNVINEASYMGLLPEDRRGQSFTVGIAGWLAGIEISPSLFYGAAPSDRLELQLFRCESIVDCAGSSLGSVTLGADEFPTEPPLILVPGSPGVGYFDVSSLGVRVNAGDVYRFDVVAHIVAPCSSDFPCAYLFALGFNDFYEDEQRLGYASGTIFDAGFVDPEPSADLNFVTYVRNAP